MFSQWLLKQVTAESCAKLLREYRWKEGVRCPYCHASQVGRMHDQNYQGVYRYRCAGCRKSFTDVTGTIFESSQATHQSLYRAECQPSDEIFLDKKRKD